MSIVRFERVIKMIIAGCAVVATTACASTGATFRSGVGDAFPEHPPYYAGASIATLNADTSRIGHLPVAYQQGASQLAIFDPSAGAGTPTATLLAEMNAYLDGLVGGTPGFVRLLDSERSATLNAGATPPNVIFGCITGTGAPDDECEDRSDVVLGRNNQRMRLAVGRPSQQWIGWMRGVMAERNVQRALVITLEVGQYLPRQRGVLGRKEVELGTGYTVNLPWLTSLETPVSVLQLTGVLVGADGLAVRIGAEGIVARRTNLLVSAVGGQELLSDKDVDEVRSLLRDDVPGSPLAWKVALRNLVAQLTGRNPQSPV